MDSLHLQKNFKDHPNYLLLTLPLIVFLVLFLIFLFKFQAGYNVLGVSTSNLDSAPGAEENK